MRLPSEWCVCAGALALLRWCYVLGSRGVFHRCVFPFRVGLRCGWYVGCWHCLGCWGRGASGTKKEGGGMYVGFMSGWGGWAVFADVSFFYFFRVSFTCVFIQFQGGIYDWLIYCLVLSVVASRFVWSCQLASFEGVVGSFVSPIGVPSVLMHVFPVVYRCRSVTSSVPSFNLWERA